MKSGDHNRTRVALLAVLLLIAFTGAAAATRPVPVGQAATTTAADAPPDPSEDVIGWENGHWYNESIAVNQSDGLNDTELDAFVARSMARVEHLRQLEFARNVTVEPITRDELRAGANERRSITTRRTAPPRTSNCGKRCS